MTSTAGFSLKGSIKWHRIKINVVDKTIDIRPTIINSLFPVLVREKYHAGGRLLFIILLKVIIISRVNATYTLGHINT